MNHTIRVLVADDHYMVRQGIRALLNGANGIEVVGEAENSQEAVDLAEKLRPDVIVMDISMPQLDGIEATERIQAMKLPSQVVILSMYANANLVRQALKKGARAYLLKRSATEELLLAVQKVVNGEVYLSQMVVENEN
ncbi:MAG: response regulator transcription factor [Chloroflexi bacterium]|nr:response regulator transcription factor [Chloroflexota bacterium]